MALSASAVRDALKTNASAISGLHVYETWPGGLVPTPALLIKPAAGAYQRTFGAVDEGEMALEMVYLAGTPTHLRAAQDALDLAIEAQSATSVRKAIEADGTLGGRVSAVFVTGWRDYGGLQVAGKEYVGCRFDVVVQP